MTKWDRINPTDVTRLRKLGLHWSKIAKRLGISEALLSAFRERTGYIDPLVLADDDDIDRIVRIIQTSGTGILYTQGVLRGMGIKVMRAEVRASLLRVNPEAFTRR